MTWLVVRNPSAGRGEGIAERLEAALDDAGILHRTVVPDDPSEVDAVVAEAVAEGLSSFAAVGGDGTANLVLNSLMRHRWESPPTLAILPAGSGSDFIRTFALPRTLEEGVARLVTDDVYLCDVGRLEGDFGVRWFLNVADVGIAAEAARKAARLPSRLGGLRYTVAFWLSLARFAPAEVTVDLGRRRVSGAVMNVVVANGQFFGGGMNVAPQAALTDGLLDVEVFFGPRVRALTVMPRVVRGLHLRHPAVRRGRTSHAVISVPEHWLVEADGEVIGAGSVTADVVAGAVNFKI